MNRNRFSQNPAEFYTHLLNDLDEHIHSGNRITPAPINRITTAPMFVKFYVSVFRGLNDKVFGSINVFDGPDNFRSWKHRL